jgi:hypothetical protein
MIGSAARRMSSRIGTTLSISQLPASESHSPASPKKFEKALPA